MGKRKNQPLIDSDSDSSDENGSEMENDLLSLANKKKKTKRLASTSPRRSSASDSDSEEETRNKAKKSRRMTHSSSSSSSSEEEEEESENEDEPQPNNANKSNVSDEKEKSDLEEGQISSDDEDEEESGSGSDNSSSSDSEFNDGFDENMMGDEEDRARLEALTEKEREQEIFKRIEERERKRTRWEIERKLKMAKRSKESSGNKKPKEKKKKKTVEKKKPVEKPPKVSVTQSTTQSDAATIKESSTQNYSSQSADNDTESASELKEEYFDPKERSKERKKNVEANRTDSRSNAMALLKARREGKQKREEEEAKREAQKKVEDEKEELDGMTGSKSSVKLKASDVYSDDSSSDSEEKKSDTERRSTSRSSSDSEEDAKSHTSSSDKKKPVEITTRDELNKLRISRHKLEKFIHLPVFEKTVIGCFVRINIGNNKASGNLVYRAAEITAVVETPKVYQFGRSRTNKGLRLKHGPQERIFRLEFVSNSDFTDSEFEKWRTMCLQYDCDLPTKDKVDQKIKDVQQALTYEFKEEDIDRIVEEKNRFRQHPTNYAMKKTTLMKEHDAAILRGEHDLARELNTQIQELEERANELDKRRTSTISLISYINNRNRRKNVEEAEKAILEEAKANKGVKYSDPFTRRSTKPTMAFKQSSNSEEPIMMPPSPPKIYKQKETKKEEHASSDIYSLHNFEIDLDVPLPMNNVPVLPKAVENKVQSSGPKRSLNLEEYKKKYGLI